MVWVRSQKNNLILFTIHVLSLKMLTIAQKKFFSIILLGEIKCYHLRILVKCTLSLYRGGGGGGANAKVPDMHGVGGVFSGPKTQK